MRILVAVFAIAGTCCVLAEEPAVGTEKPYWRQAVEEKAEKALLCPVRPGTKIIRTNADDAGNLSLIAHHRECLYAPGLEAPLGVWSDVELVVSAVKDEKSGAPRLTVDFAKPPQFEGLEGSLFPVVLGQPGKCPSHLASLSLRLFEYGLKRDQWGNWAIDVERRPLLKKAVPEEIIEVPGRGDWAIGFPIPETYRAEPAVGLELYELVLTVSCPTGAVFRPCIDQVVSLAPPSKGDDRPVVYVPEDNLTNAPRL